MLPAPIRNWNQWQYWLQRLASQHCIDELLSWRLATERLSCRGGANSINHRRTNQVAKSRCVSTPVQRAVRRFLRSDWENDRSQTTFVKATFYRSQLNLSNSRFRYSHREAVEGHVGRTHMDSFAANLTDQFPIL